MKVFKFLYTKGNIDYYAPNDDVNVYIESLNTETMEISKKQILMYTIHKNLTMYKVSDPKGRFAPFWVSDDHSLIVYSPKLDKAFPIKPLVLKESDSLLFILQKTKNGELIKIPTNEIEIEYDPTMTEAADFTVEDNFTFLTSDGVVVQDSVALYVPMMQESIIESKEKMASEHNLISPANRKLLAVFKQDVILGFVNLVKDSPEIIEKLLHNEPPLIEKLNHLKTHLTSSYINDFLVEILKYPGFTHSEKIKIIDDIYHKSIKNVYTTISLEDFYIDDLPEPDDRYKNMDDKTDERYIKKYIEEVESGKRKSMAYNIITTGSRGKWSQFKQIAIGKGYVADVFGEIVPTPIKHSLMEGLTKDEYFISAIGSRKGIVDRASNTAKSGYLTRKLIYLLSQNQLDPELDDCGTTKYLTILVKNEQMAERLVGRYLDTGEKITAKNFKSFVGKEIHLRSPIFCKAENGKICKKCYGDLYKIHKSKQIGIIAAQSLGERMTQLVLRTFHIGGIANMGNDELLPETYFTFDTGTIIARVSGTIKISKTFSKFEFAFDDGTSHVIINRNKLLEPDFEHLRALKRGYYEFSDNVPVLKIAVSKNKDIVSDLGVINTLLSGRTDLTISEFVTEIFEVMNNYGSIDMVHFEILASSLLFDKHDIPFRLSDANEYKWRSLSHAIEHTGKVLHNLAFERFTLKLAKFLLNKTDDADFKIDSLAEQLLMFDFNEEVLDVGDVDLEELLSTKFD